MIKVSVIVATYCSGSGLDRVIRSLDGQSMPSDDFEVIFIDDGSPDDTYARLKRIQRRRTNMKIAQIANSGWPSRPRNLAIEMAEGEYLLFMDHDDELSPDALYRAYELGHRNHADVVNAKESRTQFAGWSLDIFVKNVDNAIGQEQANPLMPMNPHKLYRREFLNEHMIRFPEGDGGRFIWEDIFFNIEAFRHAQVISILAETPFYHWVKTASNNSSSYRNDLHVFWDFLGRIFDFIEDQLAGTQFTRAREQLLLHHFLGRGLEFFNSKFAQRPEHEAEFILHEAQKIMAGHIPEAFDQRMSKSQQALAHLIRLGRLDLLKELVCVDAGIVGMSRTTSVAWGDGRLLIGAEARWLNAGGDGIRVVKQAGRFVRELSGAVTDALPVGTCDVTDGLTASSSQIGIRNPIDKSVWMLPTRSRVEIAVAESEQVSVSVKTLTSVDIDDVIFGGPLDAPLWEFNARNIQMSVLNQRGLRTDSSRRLALIRGRGAVAYQSKEGILRLDLYQKIAEIPDAGLTSIRDAKISRISDRAVAIMELPLDAVHVIGQTEISGAVALHRVGSSISRLLFSDRVLRHSILGWLARRCWGGKTARLVGDDRGARLTAEVRIRRGQYNVVYIFNGRPVKSHLQLAFDSTGAATFHLV